jgi:biopolymer transport protein ExbD
MKCILLLACIIVLASTATTMARPVSYPGGWTVMQKNDMDKNSLHVHYSPTAKYSVGYKTEYWRDKEWQLHSVQLNYLAKRWNQPNSQANVYLKAGAGVAYSDLDTFHSKTEPAAFSGIAFDWENRRYFTSYENRVYYAGDIEKFFMQKARVGIAPYIGDYGDVHTWLMLQVDHNPSKQDNFTVTPLIRVFKGEYLAEAGVSNNRDVLLNWIIRF